ncbi:MAG TPA: hypothetical protein VGM93_10860, partial [Acidimicrobiales bacterium]
NSTNQIAVENTLQAALEDLYGKDIPNTREASGSNTVSSQGSQGAEPTTGSITADARVNQLIAQIVTAFNAADTDARKGDQVGYAEQIKKAQGYSDDLQKAYKDATAAGKGPKGSSSTTTTTTPSGSDGGATATTTTAPSAPTTSTPKTTTSTTGL